MKIKIHLLGLLLLAFISGTLSAQQNLKLLHEGLETGEKKAYLYANVLLLSGSWNFNDALIGQTPFDKKNGTKSIRIKQEGTVTMNFDFSAGATKLISLVHARYGNDAPSIWALYASTDKGVSWQRVGDSIVTKDTHFTMVTFIKSYPGSIRFQIRKLGGGRLNIDDIAITANGKAGTTSGYTTFGTNDCGCTVGANPNDTIPTRDNNLAMGNPSNATTNTTDSNNYLLTKSQYTVSYNNSKGEPNWSSWHLSSAWKGSSARCDCFNSDSTLPSGYYKAVTSHYTNSGFDRGHLCPSEDRDGSDSDNRATFVMTNITPQAPILNEQTWASFETYCRTLMTAGNELYIIAGGYGTGGYGSNGGDSLTINNGKINVYAHYWKVAVVLPVGINDVSRITTSTRVIAIDIPNNQTVNAQTWGYYRVSVDSIEAATGFDFLSNVSTSVQTVIEASVDSGPTQ
ncbi:DNA/RNA non-specific endonuclease [Parasediminibacterium sp. JCM 36343]|uniref:DNA/RNA non-specific endonuclease n=1 Tax=Parasediminibacterium sp. JCM 36343 TaxID=3374279 RepID=UPI00397A70C2